MTNAVHTKFLVPRRPLGIDLFSGVGGLSLGFEQAGFDVIAAVEYDPVHASVHEYNFPRAETLCADVSRLHPDELLDAAYRGYLRSGHSPREWTGEIDVIFGGPPCQGFSTMGKREVSDGRNGLVFQFAQVIGALLPRYFVMENVPGMVAGGHAGILARLFARFRQLGYSLAIDLKHVKKAILNAADFGVPQDRRRLFLIGAREDQVLPIYPSPTVWRAPKRRGMRAQDGTLELLPPGPTVWDAIGNLPDLDSFDELWCSDAVLLSRRLLRQMKVHSSQYALRLMGIEDDPLDFSHSRSWEPSLLTSSMRTSHTRASIERFASTAEGDTESISRFYRLDRYGLCNTLRAGTGSERGAYTSPRPIHPTLPRVLSVREAARLHSFPDWFRLHVTKWHGFRSIGNAVPPLLGRAVARSVIDALGVQPTKSQQRIPLGDPSLLAIDRLSAAAYFGVDKRYIPETRKRLVAV